MAYLALALYLVALFSSNLFYDVSGSVDTKSLLWPVPPEVNTENGNGPMMLNPDNFHFEYSIHTAHSDILDKAFERYMGLIFQSPTPFYPDGTGPIVKAEMKLLTVQVLHADETLNQSTIESYNLDTGISAQMLSAQTVYGALRGLETFSQLIFRNKFDQYQINLVTINDYPRFQYRSTMIDTARHFLPVQTILDHLDAMSYNKMNVLHWHIVDDQSFPYTSIKFPNMSLAGAYDRYHVYSQEDIATVIKFAKYRGIRIIVEFDTPGHTQAWGKGQPDLLTECYSNGKPSGTYGPINPTLNSTWTFLESFLTEIAQVFPDDYIHLGGDEVSFSCWKSNTEIQKWMAANHYTDYSKLEQYYETALLELMSKKIGKQYIVWQEIFDNKLTVLPDTVINVWKGNWEKEMYNVTEAGLQGILSSCWYLNYISYGKDWTKYYACDPQNFNGSDAQNKLVIGGEACMWAEYVDATNFLSRFWPRGSAVAERLWSPKTITDANAAEPRLHNMRCRLMSRKIPAEPLQPSFCSFEWPGGES